MNSRRPFVRGLSVKTRFTLSLFLVAIGSVLIVVAQGWVTNRDALYNQAVAKLETIRATKAIELQDYFAATRYQLETLTENDMVVTAMVDFNRRFEELNTVPVAPEWDTAIETYYNKEFLPRLAKNISGEPIYENYRPRSQASRYLQYQYIAANTNDFDSKGALSQATDTSDYSVTHGRYHDYFRRFISNFGFDDLYLINYDNSQVIYSVQKRPDFATNLTDGAYRHSSLADVVAAVQANPTRHSLSMVDFQPYQPALAAPAGFIAGPIYNGQHIVGILAVQLPISQIDGILNANKQWTSIGLGQSGETYLVGSDFLMRSDARPFLENSDQYQAQWKAAGLPASTLARVNTFNTTVLAQAVNTTSVRSALKGDSGTLETTNYFGRPVLSTYEPVDLGAGRLALVTEMDTSELLAPIRLLEQQLLITTVVLIAIIVFLSIALTAWLLRPLTQLADGLRIATQRQRLNAVAARHDEFGLVAGTLTGLLQEEHAQLDTIQREYHERLDLLTGQLPTALVERFTNGQSNFWERFSKVTVVALTLVDSEPLPAVRPPAQSAEALIKTEDALFNIAARYDMELFTLSGGQFLAISGLSIAHPDHVRRALDFAFGVLNGILALNSEADAAPNQAPAQTAQIGIDTGAIFAGAPGLHRFGTLFSGVPVQSAQMLMASAAPNSVWVTDAVRNAVGELYTFNAQNTDALPMSSSKRAWQADPRRTETEAVTTQ